MEDGEWLYLVINPTGSKLSRMAYTRLSLLEVAGSPRLTLSKPTDAPMVFLFVVGVRPCDIRTLWLRSSDISHDATSVRPCCSSCFLSLPAKQLSGKSLFNKQARSHL